MHDNISTALITAFEQHYDTRWDDAQLRNERLAWRAAWDAAGAVPAAVAIPGSIPKELTRLADIMRDCGRLVSTSGNAEQILRTAATLLSAPAAPALEAPAAPSEDLALVLAALEHGHPRARHSEVLAAARRLAAAPQAPAAASDAQLLSEWDRVSGLTKATERRLACMRAVLKRWGSAAPAASVEPGPAGSGGWESHARQMERERDHWRDRARVMSEHKEGVVWYWQGDGEDHPESWVNTLPVVIRADELRALMGPAAPAAPREFQQRVHPWLMECFGPAISADKQERNHRFLEEALETVQAGGCTASEAHQLVDYVFGRPVGELGQEVGGAMTTLAALCLANGIDMHAEAEKELARVWTMVEKIRAKQAAKPKHSPLPAAPAAPAVDADPLGLRNVGEALMETIKSNAGALKAVGWLGPMDCPSEVVVDLLNLLEEANTTSALGEWVATLEVDSEGGLDYETVPPCTLPPGCYPLYRAAQAKEGGA